MAFSPKLSCYEIRPFIRHQDSGEWGTTHQPTLPPGLKTINRILVLILITISPRLSLADELRSYPLLPADQTTIVTTDPAALKTQPLQAVEIIWTLTEGKTIAKQLSLWADQAGWKVIWNLDKDWIIPTNTFFSGDFKTAAAAVIDTLAENGVLIRATLFEGNQTMVVSGPGDKEQ